MLIPALSTPHIQMVIEYAEADALSTMTVRCNGSQQNILGSGDALSASLLRGITDDISYGTAKFNASTNYLTLLFREKK